MEILKFVSWVWLKSMSQSDRQLTVLIVWSISATSVCLYVTGSILWSITALICSFFLGVIALMLIELVRSKWQQYKRFKDREAQAIINALRGK